MLSCPSCGRAGVNPYRLVCAGPAFPAKCRICGSPCVLPWKSSLVIALVSLPAAPAIAALALALLRGGVTAKAIAAICLAGVSSLIFLGLVELSRHLPPPVVVPNVRRQRGIFLALLIILLCTVIYGWARR